MLHPDEDQVALYLNGRLDGPARRALEAHLADCAECRAEVVEVRNLLAAKPGARRWRVMLPLTAAAAVVLWFGMGAGNGAPPVTRDAALTTTLAPAPLAPLGHVEAANRLVWSSVPGAGRYRVTLFTAEGEARWLEVVADTSVALPDSVRLEPKESYYWQVKAETGFGRWVESELVEFEVRGPGARP
jgi:hypothetical protein